MCLSFFYQQTDFYTAAIRTGWGFIICYVAVVVLVHGILRATIIEMIQQRDLDKENSKTEIEEEKEEEQEQVL
ncbi:MAG: hypothetical protein COA73_03530 [Candidatus Hydrogenedentota bacterium]|nr:MAG: hypothetical protein COA73_03530 [Candidatus Hydrogenedentota bacterium]